METVYKVVLKSRLAGRLFYVSSFVSCCEASRANADSLSSYLKTLKEQPHSPNSLALTRFYEIGITTFPAEGTKLFAFLSRLEANIYANRSSGIVLKCNAVVNRSHCWIDHFQPESSRRNFMNLIRYSSDYPSAVLCDSITPLEVLA